MYSFREDIITYFDVMNQRSPLINKLSIVELMNLTTETVAKFRTGLCTLILNLYYVYHNGRPIKKAEEEEGNH